MKEHYRGQKPNRPLQQAFKKYGLNNFSIQILEYCNIEELVDKEQYYFKLFKQKYNILEEVNFLLGFKHSEKTKQKIRMANLGKTRSKETREKISETLKGIIFSEETRKKFSLACIGITLSSETKEKISKSISGDKHSLYGNTHSVETRRKMSKAKGTSIFVYNLDLQLIETFTSATMAAQYFKCSPHTIMKYARLEKFFQSEYKLSLKELSSTA